MRAEEIPGRPSLRPFPPMRHSPAAVIASLLLATFLTAQTPPTPTQAQTPAAPAGQEPKPAAPAEPGKAAQDPAPEPTLAEQLAKFHPKEGTAKVGGYAEVKLGAGWMWLASRDAQAFLREMGNPVGSEILGVALTPDFGDSGIFAVYTYGDEGHVDDSSEPDYAELLAQMQADTVEGSKQRKANQMPGVELLGWAEPPHYDKAQRKLYWAKKLRFDDSDGLTLNYNVRVLGRAGTLEINGVGGMEQLDAVAAHCKTLLQVTDFVDGQRYTDFDASTDKVLAGGIGALIAGNLALKAGLFAKLALLLKAFIKPILLGVVVLGGLLFKLFAGRKKADSRPLTGDGAAS